jgi:hypothetical protein
MPHPATIRPAEPDFAPFYAGYVAAVPEGDVRATLRSQLAELESFGRHNEETASRPYAPGKWTLKQLAQHLADGERVFSLRLLWFARGDASPLPGFDQDTWVANGDANSRSFASLVDELLAARQSTLTLVDNLDDNGWGRHGIASGMPITVRALAWILAGHAAHHLRVLAQHGVGPMHG